MSKHCGRTPDCAQSLQSESAGHFYLGSTSDLAKDWETTWARTALCTKTRTLEVGNVWEPSSCPQTRARDQELENLQDDHELIELCANLGDRELFSCRSPSDLPRHDVERPRPRSLSPSTWPHLCRSGEATHLNWNWLVRIPTLCWDPIPQC